MDQHFIVIRLKIKRLTIKLDWLEAGLQHNRRSSPANEKHVLKDPARVRRLHRSLPLLEAGPDRPVVRQKPSQALRAIVLATVVSAPAFWEAPNSVYAIASVRDGLWRATELSVVSVSELGKQGRIASCEKQTPSAISQRINRVESVELVSAGPTNNSPSAVKSCLKLSERLILRLRIKIDQQVAAKDKIVRFAAKSKTFFKNVSLLKVDAFGDTIIADSKTRI